MPVGIAHEVQHGTVNEYRRAEMNKMAPLGHNTCEHGSFCHVEQDTLPRRGSILLRFADLVVRLLRKHAACAEHSATKRGNWPKPSMPHAAMRADFSNGVSGCSPNLAPRYVQLRSMSPGIGPLQANSCACRGSPRAGVGLLGQRLGRMQTAWADLHIGGCDMAAKLCALESRVTWGGQLGGGGGTRVETEDLLSRAPIKQILCCNAGCPPPPPLP